MEIVKVYVCKTKRQVSNNVNNNIKHAEAETQQEIIKQTNPDWFGFIQKSTKCQFKETKKKKKNSMELFIVIFEHENNFYN